MKNGYNTPLVNIDLNSELVKARLKTFATSVESQFFQSPLIMGIVNVTPDSFSDGGYCMDAQQALSHARKLMVAGADVLDIGGESSRPGAQPVIVDEELSRVIPVIELIRHESSICISIDTSKPVVMRAAVAAGANIINDITALQYEDALATAAELAVPVCLMHMQGTPKTMQDAPSYPQGVVQAVNDFFSFQITRCLQAGIQREHLILDPGFGFGKSVAHNLQLLNQLHAFTKHQLPLLLGVSRKSTLGSVLNKPVDARVMGGIAVAVWASLQGIAMLRTHDVDETKQALLMIEAVRNESDLRGSE